MKLSKKLTKIQSGLNAPKNQHNSFGNYYYRSAEDILEVVKPLLNDNGCQIVISDDIVAVGERVYVKATATFTDGKNEIVATAFAREADSKKSMDESQITGSASSYARKYALNGLLLIDDAKDADTDEFDKQTKAKTPGSKPETQKGLDFNELRTKYQKMTDNELRKEYAAVKTYKGWSEKQKNAVCNIIMKIQKERGNA